MVNKIPLLARLQKTIARQVGCSGVGLHAGEQVSLLIKPAMEDTGICFYRSDIHSHDNKIPALVKHVVGTNRSTSIGNVQGAQVNTIEHLLAALLALGIDNAEIVVDGLEIPAMDGSAEIFTLLLLEAGTFVQGSPRKFIRVLKEVEVRHKNSFARLSPHEGFEVDVGINYENQVIGEQSICFDVSRKYFIEELTKARTFSLRSEVDDLYRNGKGAGGSLDNCIVVGDAAVENRNGLWKDDEFVRHKAIDVLGDMSLAGGSLLGRYYVRHASHRINIMVLQKLFSDDDAWEMVAL
ncbi:MAG: UDP-3-O-[3-hydroxymyristoyl] N-acetylglucosamine deacetylase [Robiginitomaculum sp.]|nr:UDP-3-O-[3-hydroxymyristoyl] N-acetylglucosamine deacetylase [Robiginitomaculum sp.]